ncbi:MAG: peptidase U32 family (collagenase-like) [Rhodospirillaceae bacterium]|nr:MAG: peptidase U32 family (collagenase-like) [Rhodospirillaceae bacterium]
MGVHLTLGPVLYNWPASMRRDFYFRIADEAPLDTVYVGEVVCAKRAPLFDSYWPEVIERLQAAGKTVVHASPILATGQEGRLRAMGARDFPLPVEANDVGAIGMLRGRPHYVGPFVNVYNPDTLAVLVRQGAVRVCLPVDVPHQALAVLAGAGAVEVSVFGRVPLSISARCYHARVHGLHKDSCRYVCEQDPDGLDVTTLDQEPLMAINGVQTLSHAAVNLVHVVADLVRMGVGAMRLWPQAVDMTAVAQVFRAVLKGREDAAAAWHRLRTLVPHLPFVDGFFHGVEGCTLVADHA